MQKNEMILQLLLNYDERNNMSKNTGRLFLNRTAKLGRNNNMVKGITIKNPSLSSDNEGDEEE